MMKIIFNVSKLQVEIQSNRKIRTESLRTVEPRFYHRKSLKSVRLTATAQGEKWKLSFYLHTYSNTSTHAFPCNVISGGRIISQEVRGASPQHCPTVIIISADCAPVQLTHHRIIRVFRISKFT